MNLKETNTLLLFAQAVDNRKVDDATVITWQSILRDVEAGDAMEAARIHFGTSRDYLTPAIIAERVRMIGDARRRHEQAAAAQIRQANRDARALTSAPADPAENARILAALREKLPPSRPGIIGERVRVKRKTSRPARAFGDLGLHVVADINARGEAS